MKKFFPPRERREDPRRDEPRRPAPRPHDRAPSVVQDDWIWGQHSVEACVDTCPEKLLEIFVEKKAANELKGLTKKLQDYQLSYVEKLPRFLSEKRTQGVAAKIKGFPVHGIEKFYEREPVAKGQIVVLDRIQDTQNFGAILRSAAALGARAVIIGSREQAPVNGTVAQVSAGNLFKTQIYVCHNLAKTCEKLKEIGFTLLALESEGKRMDQTLAGLESPAIAWLLGAEEDGIQASVLKTADQKVGIPMSSGVESLNVSNSAAIALYEGFKKLNS